MTPAPRDDTGTLTATRLVLAYALGFALFDLGPVALSDVDAFKGLTWGDLVDFPLVVLPAALLFHMGLDAGLWRSVGLRAVLLLGLLVLVQGHAVHLAANAISHHLGTSSPAWESTYFLDENLSHYELQVALLGLAALFIGFGRRSRLPYTPEYALLGLAILGYGALQAAGAIEGQTVLLVLPASVVLSLFGAWNATRRRSEYATFFAASYAVCFLGLVIYGVINHGWPEIL